MFSKLISRFQEKKSDHPLGSDENFDALLADIPQSDPARLLFDVDHWLAGMDAATAEIGAVASMRALLRLDQFSREAAGDLLVRYLRAGGRDYLSESAWSALDTHAAHLLACYQAALNLAPELKTDDDKLRMARVAVRAMVAWALRKKLLRFRYRVPDAAVWQEAHELVQLAGRLGLLQLRVMPYRDEAETTVLREYAIGVYLDLVPLGNMVPQQLELAEDFLRSLDGLDLSVQPHSLSTHRVDLAAAAGPRALKQADEGGPGVRYCSVLKLRGALMTLAGQIKKAGEKPLWISNLPATAEQIEGAVLMLMTHWAPAPPKRSKDRFDQKLELKVVLGFGLARRMIAASTFARMGRSLKYEGDDITRMFDEARFGTVAANSDPKQLPIADDRTAGSSAEVVNPLEILSKLELGGDKALMENWVQVDGSATGIGVVVPAILPRHRIGVLACFRYSDGLEWRLGLIRRIGRDAANRPGLGIETLAWPSICAMAKPVGQESAWTKVADGGHGWSDAIIVSHDGRQMILPEGAFFSGLEIDVRSQEGLWRVRMDELLDRGPDFDRVEFTRIT